MKSRTDLIIVDTRLWQDVVDAKVVRGMYGGSDPFMLLPEPEREKWGFRGNGKGEKSSQELVSEKVCDRDLGEMYGRRVEKVHGRARA